MGIKPRGRKAVMTGSTPGELPSAAWPLLALAIGTFAIGTSEFMPMGLLPVLARGLDVSIPSAGLLVSAYASALAPGFGVLLIARLVTSLSHGAYSGLGSIMATNVVPKHRQARALAVMLSGLPIANIGGVPAATWLGEQVGWRLAFAGTTGLGVLAMVALAIVLPRGEGGRAPNLLQEVRILSRPTVLFAMATTVMSASAMFALYTYVAPVLENLAGASEGFITVTLVLIGIGFTVGMGLGGRLADWPLDGSIGLSLAAVALIMLAFPWLLTSHVGAAVGLTAWGAAAFALVPSLQVRVVRAAAEAPGLASSINVGAFNLGNALGALVGGGVIGLHLGYKTVPVAGGVLAIIGLAIALVGQKITRSAVLSYEPSR